MAGLGKSPVYAKSPVWDRVAVGESRSGSLQTSESVAFSPIRQCFDSRYKFRFGSPLTSATGSVGHLELSQV